MGIERGTRNEGNIWVKTEGKGQPYGIGLKDELLKAGVVSIPEVIEFVSSKQGERKCLGTRKLLSRDITHNEAGKPVEKLELGDYEWITYSEVNNLVDKVAAGFIDMGFARGSRVAIFAETRADWYVMGAGCLKVGLTLVTLYTNLSNEAIVHGIEETEVDTVITSHEMLPRLTAQLEKLPNIVRLIVMEDQLEGIGEPTNVPERVKVVPFKEFISTGDISKINELPKPQKEEIAILMYTSGSTGNPKGVQLSHENILWAMFGWVLQADLNPTDCYIAYLPLAHVMELATETSLLAMGVSIIYSSPFTLTNNSSKIKPGTLGDARVGRPTAMNAVPLILDRIYKGVLNNVNRGGKMKEIVFNEALKLKQNETRKGFALTSKILDVIVFNKVKAELGGQLKQLVVGGSHLSPQTYKTIRAMFGCRLHVGYGATETASSITSMDADDSRAGHCGPPNLGVMIKLVDWDEGCYKVTDSPRPRGEIIVGGPMVSKGYFKNVDETEKSFYEEDGVTWFRTGDIGEFDETGVLYIIDRKKDIVKLKHGEYVSLGYIESMLKTYPLIDNICVFGRSGHDNIVAIVCPNMDKMKSFADEFNINKETTPADLCLNEKIVKHILSTIQHYAKEQRLSRWETPMAVHLTSTIWTPDNGLVTAAQKLRRKPLENEYSDVIKEMYESLDKA